jgi:eukaryotic-like serine/threonine-protein kinase
MISKKIRLVRQLGSGGMGTVWMADDLALDTQLAVKFMSPAHARVPALVKRFEREGKLAARMRSPHVVDVFDYAATDDGIPYIVMELLSGENLDTRITREGALGLELTLRILLQVSRALGRAHGMGIIHRDIKPDNIFLVGSGSDVFVKILDFGIAKQEDELPGLTTSGSTIGTPCYMSPEQLLDPKSVDERSDLWSLGVVIYHCLTGAVPFARESFGAICVAIHEGSFAPPSGLRAAIPPSVDAWMVRALCRDARGRFRSAEEMCEAFIDGLAKDRGPRAHAVESLPSLCFIGDALDARAEQRSAARRARGTSHRIPLVLLAVAALSGLELTRSLAATPEEPLPLGGIGSTSRALALDVFRSAAELPPLNPTPPSTSERGLSDPVPLSISSPWRTFAEPDLRPRETPAGSSSPAPGPQPSDPRESEP